MNASDDIHLKRQLRTRQLCDKQQLNIVNDMAHWAHLDTQCVCYHTFKLIYIEEKEWKVVNILDDWLCGSDYLNMWINFGSNVKSIMSFTKSKFVQR